MAKRCRQLCIVLFVTVWFIIAEGSFCKLVHAELLQEKSEESDFAEDMDEALSELDLSDLEQFVSDNLSKTHIGFGELVRNLIHADRPISDVYKRQPYYLVKKMEISFIGKISPQNFFTHFLQEKDRQMC